MVETEETMVTEDQEEDHRHLRQDTAVVDDLRWNVMNAAKEAILPEIAVDVTEEVVVVVVEAWETEETIDETITEDQTQDGTGKI